MKEALTEWHSISTSFSSGVFPSYWTERAKVIPRGGDNSLGLGAAPFLLSFPLAPLPDHQGSTCIFLLFSPPFSRFPFPQPVHGVCRSRPLSQVPFPPCGSGISGCIVMVPLGVGSISVRHPTTARGEPPQSRDLNLLLPSLLSVVLSWKGHAALQDSNPPPPNNASAPMHRLRLWTEIGWKGK